MLAQDPSLYRYGEKRGGIPQERPLLLLRAGEECVDDQADDEEDGSVDQKARRELEPQRPHRALCHDAPVEPGDDEHDDAERDGLGDVLDDGSHKASLPDLVVFCIVAREGEKGNGSVSGMDCYQIV